MRKSIRFYVYDILKHKKIGSQQRDLKQTPLWYFFAPSKAINLLRHNELLKVKELEKNLIAEREDNKRTDIRKIGCKNSHCS